MSETLDFTSTPDLRRLFVTSLVRRHPPTGPGAVLPPVRARQDGIRIDTDRLIRYARVCGFTVGEALPLTYPHVLGFPLQVAVMARADFPFALVGLVHVENVITWSRPLTPGDTLDIEVRPQGPRAHRRGQVFDLVTDVSVAGAPVWHGLTTYLARGKGDREAPAAQPPSVAELGEGTVTIDVPGDIGRRYAGVSGDPNPIHMYAVTARLFGFKSAIAHGMWSYARVLAALGPSVLRESGTSSVWFRKPVPVGRPTRLAVSQDGRLAVLRPERGDDEHLITQQSD